jgi:hypothetical protein
VPWYTKINLSVSELTVVIQSYVKAGKQRRKINTIAPFVAVYSGVSQTLAQTLFELSPLLRFTIFIPIQGTGSTKPFTTPSINQSICNNITYRKF